LSITGIERMRASATLAPVSSSAKYATLVYDLGRKLAIPNAKNPAITGPNNNSFRFCRTSAKSASKPKPFIAEGLYASGWTSLRSTKDVAVDSAVTILLPAGEMK
jgi:hypothetical protein